MFLVENLKNTDKKKINHNTIIYGENAIVI